MKKQKADWSKESLEAAVKQSLSVSECLRLLGLHHGSSHNTYKKYIKLYNIDTSHFEPRNARTAKRIAQSRKTPTSEFLVIGSVVRSSTIKRRILEENLLEYECVGCGLTDTWNGAKIILHLDHINGNNKDNRLENLRFLCPNCHSQTDTYCGRNSEHVDVKRIDDNKCIECQTPVLWGYSKRCRSCAAKECQPTKIVWPDIKTLQEMVDADGYSQTGRTLGVSDNAVRKHLRMHGGPSRI